MSTHKAITGDLSKQQLKDALSKHESALTKQDSVSNQDTPDLFTNMLLAGGAVMFSYLITHQVMNTLSGTKKNNTDAAKKNSSKSPVGASKIFVQFTEAIAVQAIVSLLRFTKDKLSVYLQHKKS